MTIGHGAKEKSVELLRVKCGITRLVNMVYMEDEQEVSGKNRSMVLREVGKVERTERLNGCYKRRS